MSSGTLPEFYDFRKLGERQFCDGGLLSNTPFRELLQAHQDYWLRSINIKADNIRSEADKHNQNLSIYADFLNNRIRTAILYLLPSLKECDIGSILFSQSYYLSNIRAHFKNAYPDNRVVLKIEQGTKNRVNGLILYSDGMEIAFGDKPCLDSLKAFIQEYTLIIIKEIKGYDENIHNIGIFLDD